MRGLLASVAALLGYGGITFSLAQATAKGDPRLAHRLAPYDGRITALRAASLGQPEASEAERRRADVLARAALRQDPTSVVASATLGFVQGLRGDAVSARRQLGYAQRLSRRNLQVQIWAIEDAVGRGDVAGALRQYDIALRTTPSAEGTLFPVLAAASADPAIRGALVRTLIGRPLWGERFIEFVGGYGADPRSTAALFVGLRRAGVEVPEEAQAGALAALVMAGLHDQAWAYYAAIRPGADRRRSRDPRFAADLSAPSLLDWTVINDGGTSGSIQPSAFDFTAPASVGGPLLQQTQMLPPGTYRLTGHTDGIEQVDGARPYWVLACRGGKLLGRVDVPNSVQAGGTFAGTVAVPLGCPVQYLTLMASPSDAVGGLSGRIDRAELVPLG